MATARAPRIRHVARTEPARRREGDARPGLKPAAPRPKHGGMPLRPSLLVAGLALACAEAPATPCPAYSGLGTDRAWTWSDGEARWTVESAAEAEAGDATASVTVSDGRGTTTHYTCEPDGLYLQHTT